MKKRYIPMINVSQDRTSILIMSLDICFNPCNQMVFKSSLDNLMEDIRSYQFMDVGSWKAGSEWLFWLFNTLKLIMLSHPRNNSPEYYQQYHIFSTSLLR